LSVLETLKRVLLLNSQRFSASDVIDNLLVFFSNWGGGRGKFL